jgi:hypothetical protein
VIRAVLRSPRSRARVPAPTLALTLALLVANAGCGAGSASAQGGFSEPIQVLNGQFFPGDMVAGTSGPVVRSLSDPNNSVRQGQSGWGLSGDAQAGTWAVALRFADLGSGYWVVPVSSPDFSTPSDLLWGARVEFSRDLPPGTHDMNVITVKADQTFGPLTSSGIKRLTVLPLLPNADVVLSLEWDTDADLDLHLTGPLELGMSEVYPKQPSTAAFDGVANKFPPGTGLLDRDSEARCVRDGFRREDVVWNSHETGATALGPPVPGNYLIRVDMFDACGQGYANFKVTLFDHAERTFSKVGRLLSTDADAGGPGSGLFVAQIQF